MPKIKIRQIDTTGTATASTTLKGDGSWSTPIPSGTVAPTSPSTGDLWIDTN